MTQDNKENNSEPSEKDEDVEKLFKATWNNWASRRRCEKTHRPKYIDQEQDD